jgi:hypothetical protein
MNLMNPISHLLMEIVCMGLLADFIFVYFVYYIRLRNNVDRWWQKGNRYNDTNANLTSVKTSETVWAGRLLGTRLCNFWRPGTHLRRAIL